MTTGRRRVATGLILAVILLFAVPISSQITVSWYHRWQASRLLACLRKLHPGVTTEADARASLAPFADEQYPDNGNRQTTEPLTYQFYNCPGWTWRLASYLPFHWGERLTLPWTLVEMTVKYRDGYLSQIDIVEMQEDQSGGPHPTAASVEILSTRFEKNSRYLPEDFTGYSVYSRSTGALDQNQHWTNFDCCHERFIHLDERASPSQLSQSQDFQLHCMTSYRRCKDDRQILP